MYNQRSSWKNKRSGTLGLPINERSLIKLYVTRKAVSEGEGPEIFSSFDTFFKLVAFSVNINIFNRN